MKEQELIPHLFRNESGKITAVLARIFGFEQIELAEDITSETFLAALENWPYKGVPENPVAWLYAVAKNKARNHLERQVTFRNKVLPGIKPSIALSDETDIDLSIDNIADSQLKMLFAVCHPAISPEAQIALSLRLLCGFSADEIAHAFLTSTETVYKRINRAKGKLKTINIRIELPPEKEVLLRMENVLKTLYLLFNEGYYSETNEAVIREDFCAASMRLTSLLLENKTTNHPAVNALYALMCFHSSRFHARKKENGEMILYDDQDTGLWDQELIGRGAYYLHLSAQGDQLTPYHLEANIAYWHTVREDIPAKWENILQLYNRLLQAEYSPVAALNRTFALSKVRGPEAAIGEAEKLKLDHNPYYYTLLGELYRAVDPGKALDNFQKAFASAKTKTDRNIIQSKINRL